MDQNVYCFFKMCWTRSSRSCCARTQSGLLIAPVQAGKREGSTQWARNVGGSRSGRERVGVRGVVLSGKIGRVDAWIIVRWVRRRMERWCMLWCGIVDTCASQSDIK